MALPIQGLVQLTISGIGLQAQENSNVFYYYFGGGGFLNNATIPQMAEAWWNHVKTAYRGIYPVAFTEIFQEIKIVELDNPSGDLGTWAIPPAEQAGTRAATGDAMPSFTSASLRLNVGTRATRPGQKRFSCLMESDQNNGLLVGGISTALQTLGGVISSQMLLGAPVALGVMVPIIVTLGANYTVLARQDVVGYQLNPWVTSQRSRKAY